MGSMNVANLLYELNAGMTNVNAVLVKLDRIFEVKTYRGI